MNNIYDYIPFAIFTILSLPLLFMICAIGNGMLFRTKRGFKFVRFLGYKSNATLGQFVRYATNDPSVKKYMNDYYILVVKNYVACLKKESDLKWEEYTKFWYSYYRKEILARNIRREYKASMLIAIRNVYREIKF